MRRDTCVLWQRRKGCDNMAFIVEGYPKALKKQVRRPSGSTLIDLVQPKTHADHAVDTLYLKLESVQPEEDRLGFSIKVYMYTYYTCDLVL